ncbi:M20/M25/M40 family metallo-hydrolase [Gloeobacter violaceus]|uniref:Gll4423 protein n=1 Tax=Gloeobacter violaceus (strain ATCC 29082 / PCC 7421) TaxID=251221 RepID=Q7ND13_GLOVI|nr:M20/M25/M40 family metallo-hydrolase [Gloeobacter violaceus]BAC92364.1 gll4423 [Gloeobacter violaceus PCC 7421]
MLPIRRLLACTALICATALGPAASAQTDNAAGSGKDWWSHVRFLADDRLEGRNTGSESYLQAARYVAEQFKRAGALPAGSEGYLQPVKFQSRVLDEGRSSLTLMRGGTFEALAIGDDAVIGVRNGIAPNLEAPLVFAGYGLTVPENNYDDLAGLDLQGKIAVVLSGGPAAIPGALRSHYGSVAERWKFLKQAGAVGLITVQNPRIMDIPWERSKLLRFFPSMVLAESALQDAPDLVLTVGMNPASMDKLLAGSGVTFAQILAAADTEKPLPKFAIPAVLKAQVSVKSDTLTSANVAAMLPGSDPKLKNEYIVLSAHLDHLGIGEPIGGDRIYNGAMDNAAGVATLIDVAAGMRAQNLKLKRSVVFLAVCGEEKGLLGSKFFANRPTMRPLVANFNMDMFLPIHPLTRLTALGLEESNLAQPLRESAGQVGVTVISDPEPNRNSFVRSDQYSFIRTGVPALAFKFGYEKGSAEEKLQKAWLTTRYHAPSDDINQPVDLEAAAKFNRIIEGLLVRVANQSERPEWNAASFFKRFALTAPGGTPNPAASSRTGANAP